MRVRRAATHVGRTEPEQEVGIMAYIRKCEKCGSVDSRERWSSPTEAASKDAFDGWSCPSCVWTEFDLVDEETQAEPQATATAQ
jgi:hypothetical protein